MTEMEPRRYLRRSGLRGEVEIQPQPEKMLTPEEIELGLNTIVSNIDAAHVGLTPFEDSRTREKKLIRIIRPIIEKIRKTGISETELFLYGYRLGRGIQEQEDRNRRYAEQNFPIKR